ncbi:MAG TPA: exopolysaccharide biosynthesis polyprenyl glycosylphosphotransferase [Thermoleophilaceae bacterium]
MSVREAQAVDPAIGGLDAHESPARADTRRRRFSALFGRATELGAFREGELSRAVLDRDTRFRRGLAAADVVAVLVAAAPILAAHGAAPRPAAVLLLPLLVASAKVAGLYDRDENLLSKTTIDELPSLFHVVTVFTVIFWLFEPVLVTKTVGRPSVAILWLALFAFAALGRAGARRIALRRTPVERCLVLGEHATAAKLAAKLSTSRLARAQVVGYVPLAGGRLWTNEQPPHGGLPRLGSVSNLPVALWEHRIDRVLIDSSTTPTGDRILDKIRLIKSVGVKVSLLPRLLEVVGWSVALDEVEGLPLMGVRGYGLTKSSRFLKRALDVAGALGALTVFAPLLVVIGLAVRLTSSGPVLFRQRRVGRGGRTFDLLKFRTMYADAEERKHDLLSLNEADGLFKIADDPRITPLGRLLRRCSLDELPQLINVLRGEMSLVGPRPLVVEEDSRIQGWLRRRLDVTPGMTGIWQVLGSARVPLHEMVKLDYLYRANWSLWLDIKILIRTVPFVIARRGL